MAIEGDFTVSSGRMMGSYRERSYEYEVIQVDREDGRTIGENEKESITVDDLREGDRIFFTATRGGDEVLYRWTGGPFESKRDLEEAIEDILLYKSP